MEIGGIVPEEIVERVRARLLEAAQRAYEDAGVRGLCEEGRWEAAIDAIRSVDLARYVGDRPGEPPKSTEPE